MYAGEDVLWLINKYKDTIRFADYFYNPGEVKCFISNLNSDNKDKVLSVSNQYYRTTQFNLSYRRDMDNGIISSKKTQLPLFATIAHEIIITNCSLFDEKTITIEDDYFNNTNFEINTTNNFERKIKLPPASTTVVVVFLKLITLSENLSLPIPKFDMEVEIITRQHNIECCWLGEIPLIGSEIGRAHV